MNCGATSNALVLNHFAGVRLSDSKSGNATTFGRCHPNPANALKLVVCVIAKGIPDWRLTIPVSSHPLVNAPRIPVGSIRVPVQQESPRCSSHKYVGDVAR